MTTEAPIYQVQAILTGSSELDNKLGGGIPFGSMTLVEGQSDAGKSVLSQHLTYGALQNELTVAYYSTENTVKSLVEQMTSLSMDITDWFLMNRVHIYPLTLSTEVYQPREVSQGLLRHIRQLPEEVSLVVVDSITNLITHSNESDVLDLFTSCKAICDTGRTVVLVVHAHAFDEKMLIRVRSLCDAHLRLHVEEVGEQLVKVLEVAKIRKAERATGNIVSFDVEPGLGMRVIPISKAKA